MNDINPKPELSEYVSFTFDKNLVSEDSPFWGADDYYDPETRPPIFSGKWRGFFVVKPKEKEKE